MWDFDDYPLILVETALKYVQNKFELPNIYILNTGKSDHFIAYCFEKMAWILSVEIVASTSLVDKNFFKYGVYRERWTLRVSPKEGRKPKLVKVLRSEYPETASIGELNSWVKDALYDEGHLANPHSSHTPMLLFSLYTIRKGLGTSAYNMRHSLMLRL
jgi:hypothetical protein